MFMSAVAVAVKGGMRSNVLLCRAWSADRGGGAERRRGWKIAKVAVFLLCGIVEKLFCSCGSTPSALSSHFPYIALTRDTGGDIAGSGLWFRVES